MSRTFATVGLLSFAACTFPDVDVGAGGSTGAITDSTSPTGAGSGTESTTMGTGTSSPTSSSTGIADCDADDDGYAIEASGCCTLGDDPPCDCDDDDDAVHPGVTAYSTTPRKNAPTGPRAFDFDCSGEGDFELEVGACGVCATSADAEFFDPDGGQPEACAATGKRRFCAGVGSCQQDDTYTTLACR